jgi:hypothetical protein
MHAGDTVISAVPIPATLNTKEVRISLKTDYPFKNQFVYEVDAKKNMKFVVRIPSFAKNIVVDGNAVKNNEDLIFDINKDEKRTIKISFETKPKFVDRPHDLKTVKCGSLMFSLPIKFEKLMHEYTH